MKIYLDLNCNDKMAEAVAVLGFQPLRRTQFLEFPLPPIMKKVTTYLLTHAKQGLQNVGSGPRLHCAVSINTDSETANTISRLFVAAQAGKTLYRPY